MGLLGGTASAPLHSQHWVNAVWGGIRDGWESGAGRLGKTQLLFSPASLYATPTAERRQGQASPNCHLLPREMVALDGGSPLEVWTPQLSLCCCMGATGVPPGTAPHSPLPTCVLALLCMHMCKPLVPTEPNSSNSAQFLPPPTSTKGQK